MHFFVSDDYISYEAGNLFRIFFPYEQLTLDKENLENADLSILVDGNIAKIKVFDKYTEVNIKDTEKATEVKVTGVLYQMLSEHCGYTPKWGMITGIHPVKFYGECETKFGEDEAKRILREKYFVSEEKTKLCKQIYDIEKPTLDAYSENDFSLYVSIPFCPSRCSYCSFVSQSIEKKANLIPPYFELLLKEIEYTSCVAKKNNLSLKSVYIGGGTPSTLSAKQLEELILKIRESFDFTNCTEFTVEAGRADTIDREKLLAIKNCGVERISVNPQSLNDEVLKLIGRKHTAQQFVDIYKMAKEIGFKVINTDLIAGLEGDTFESFKDTLNKIIALDPENVTVHSLALKRAAEIFRNENTKNYHSDKDTATKMIEYSIKRLSEEGYIPYYLYRQSRMAANSENTGWAKPNTICEYNIYTMDESQTVLACGAGGVSKLKDPYSNRLERVFNFKYSYEYISRFDEIIKRKDEVTNLYEQFRKRLY